MEITIYIQVVHQAGERLGIVVYGQAAVQIPVSLASTAVVSLAAHHVLCRTHARDDVAYTKTAWTDGALSPSFQHVLAPIAE